MSYQHVPIRKSPKELGLETWEAVGWNLVRVIASNIIHPKREHTSRAVQNNMTSRPVGTLSPIISTASKCGTKDSLSPSRQRSPLTASSSRKKDPMTPDLCSQTLTWPEFLKCSKLHRAFPWRRSGCSSIGSPRQQQQGFPRQQTLSDWSNYHAPFFFFKKIHLYKRAT